MHSNSTHGTIQQETRTRHGTSCLPTQGCGRGRHRVGVSMLLTPPWLHASPQREAGIIRCHIRSPSGPQGPFGAAVGHALPTRILGAVSTRLRHPHERESGVCVLFRPWLFTAQRWALAPCDSFSRLRPYYTRHRCVSTISTHSVEALEWLGVPSQQHGAHGKREEGRLNLPTQDLHGSRSACTIQ
jgi:hypothetical protein